MSFMRFFIFYLLSLINFYWNYQDYFQFDNKVTIEAFVCEVPKHFFDKHFTRFCVLKINDDFQFGSFYYRGSKEFNFLELLKLEVDLDFCLDFNDQFCRSKIAVNEFAEIKDLTIVESYFTGIKFFDYTKFFLKNFSINQARLILGMLFGNQLVFDYEQMQIFYRSQVSHLIVASGQNITFLIDFIMLGLSYIPRYFHFFLIYPLLLIYFFIVGFSPPIFRAICMFYLLKKFQKISKIQLIIFGIYLISIFWPIAIFYSLSLQMSLVSFVAVLYAIDFFDLNQETNEFYKLFLILVMSNLFIFVYLYLIDFEFGLYGFMVNLFLIPFLYTLDLLIILYFSVLILFDFVFLKVLIAFNLDFLWQIFYFENLDNQIFYLLVIISIYFFVFILKFLK